MRSDEGYTLLEILLALTILSLAAVGVSLALPQWGSAANVRQASGELHGLLIAARDRALETQRPAVVRFGADRVVVEQDRSAGKSELAMALPRDTSVEIADNSLAAQNAIVFFPDGSSTGGVIKVRHASRSTARRAKR